MTCLCLENICKIIATCTTTRQHGEAALDNAPNAFLFSYHHMIGCELYKL